MAKYMKGFTFYAVSNLDDRIANADQVGLSCTIAVRTKKRSQLPIFAGGTTRPNRHGKQASRPRCRERRVDVDGKPSWLTRCEALPAVLSRSSERYISVWDFPADPLARGLVLFCTFHVSRPELDRVFCPFVPNCDSGNNPGHRALRRVHGGALLQHHQARVGHARVRQEAFGHGQ